MQASVCVVPALRLVPVGPSALPTQAQASFQPLPMVSTWPRSMSTGLLFVLYSAVALLLPELPTCLHCQAQAVSQWSSVSTPVASRSPSPVGKAVTYTAKATVHSLFLSYPITPRSGTMVFFDAGVPIPGCSGLSCSTCSCHIRNDRLAPDLSAVHQYGPSVRRIRPCGDVCRLHA